MVARFFPKIVSKPEGAPSVGILYERNAPGNLRNDSPNSHNAKEQRADDRQRPDDIQEVRRCERGHKTADTALQDREDQDINPDDDQPNESYPPYLCGL